MYLYKSYTTRAKGHPVLMLVKIIPVSYTASVVSCLIIIFFSISKPTLVYVHIEFEMHILVVCVVYVHIEFEMRILVVCAYTHIMHKKCYLFILLLLVN